MKPFTFWKWKHISKKKNILKMKVHSETHFENENMPGSNVWRFKKGYINDWKFKGFQRGPQRSTEVQLGPKGSNEVCSSSKKSKSVQWVLWKCPKFFDDIFLVSRYPNNGQKKEGSQKCTITFVLPKRRLKCSKW